MCAKDDLVGRKGPLLIFTQTWEVLPNHVDTFGSDFAFSFAAWLQRIKCTLGDVDSLFADNILSLIAFIISYRLFADELVYALRDVAAWLVYVIIGNLSCEARRRRSTPGTLLAGFILITKIRDPLLKTLENAAKSGILLACADGRIRQCYLTICAILRCLDKGHDDFVHLVDCFGWKHYNFNIYVSLATDTLHLLLKGLVMKMLDFMQDMLDDIYPGSRKTWDNSTTLRFCQVMHSTGLKRFNNKRAFTELVAVVSLLFVLKALFALHFIRAVCDLVTLAQYKSYDEDTLAYIQGALERMNVFKEEFRFYSMTNKKEYILQICLHNSRRTALLAADYATVVKQSRLSTTVDIQDRTYSTRVTRSLPFRRLGCEVAANIAISDFIHAAAVFIHLSIKCWRSSGKRHNDPEHCDEEVVRCAPNWQQTGLWRRDYVWLYLILIIIDYTRYDKDGKHMAYIGAFSEVLLVRRRAWNAAPKRWTLQAFKFYDLSTIIRLVHLVLRDLPDLITCTTMSYYVNNYIDWDEYNCLYSLTFDIDLLRTLREYRRKRIRNN
ncbi:hypothetical protein HBI15_097510 [Parastagonospora nodorum]|nr:hypothetical protein HBI15_097510 [Parastagonospora nodorum]